MAPISVKIVMDNGAVTRTIKIDSSQRVSDVIPIVEEKMLNGASGKDYGLFLNSADDDKSGIWLEGHRNVDYYMLRDGDSLQYLPKTRTMRIRMLDGSVKTMQVDESKPVEDLMLFICSKIGITNHDEYGLCREEQIVEAEEQKPTTGTLTLKRKAHKEERDAILEQMSKKLKTDDNVEWLDHHRTLREMAVDQKETLLLKRRLFYSDRRIDARDPVQLNLLYVQTRDAILEGRHPVTVDQAVEFAGIQCQIHYGDFQEEKHKPGFIENLREFLPEEYATSWGVEKKILKAYKKHVGSSQLDAKYSYTRTARELPTYGVTFFLVKEQQKNKKKLVPRLLGINASSILRLDEVTKDILQVWPLTQVKTFHAGKTNSFTLNFGDYSDKEYSVKTNDAHRIRDILQGYIDLIRKRMAGPFNSTQVEGGIIYQDSVESSRANIMEIVSNQPGRLIEESFVGPSRIISVEQGTPVSQGTQITTVQQIMIKDKLKSQQQGVSGEVPMRSDFVRKLNRMNSSSVKIVTLLSDADQSNAKRAEVQDIVNTMKENMPDIENGVRQAAEKQDEEARKKLLDELQELSDSMCAMVNSVDADSFNSVEAEDTAKKIANLTTEMYCSLDPRTKRRSELFSTHSRQSFIEDQKTRDSINQAACITAASNALRAVDSANESLSNEDYGPAVLEGADASLDKSAAERLDRLNAAVSMYLTAYENPNHVDYPTMTQSMQTVQLELPELAKDLKTLSKGDDKHRKELLDKSRALCEALRKLCMYTNAGDRDNIQDAAKNYGDKSRHLLSYIYSPVGCRNPNKENEIMELAKQAADKTSILLAKTNELASLSPNDPEAHEVDRAGAACADSARNLLTCAQLTAPSIHEPHCQSALTAAAENVSSSAQHLAATWKPLLKDPSRHQIAEDLRARAMDLAKALDRLKEAYSVPDHKNNGKDDEESALKKRQRMQFLMTKKIAQNNLQNAEKELDKPIEALKPGSTADALERSLAKRLGELNAAIASLIAATSDKENPDYDKAETAISTISKLMPEVIKGTKTLSATKDDKERQAMLDSIRSLCDATNAICAGIESEDQPEGSGEAATKFANSSGRLLYTFCPNLSQNKEHQVIDLSKATCEAASELLAHAYRLAEMVEGEEGARVDARGARVADNAQTLLTTAQITAPSIHELDSRAALLSAADGLAQSAHHLAEEWTPLMQSPKLQPLGKELDHALQSLEERIEKLKKACEATDDIKKPTVSPDKEKQRFKFIATKTAAHTAVQNAEKELDKPVIGTKVTGSTADEFQRALAEKLARLNAAIASLISATSDRENPDYEAAENAANTISQLMPTVVKDTKTLTAGKSDKERKVILDEIRALCDATRGICASDGHLSNGDLNDAAVKFANSSGRLLYTFSPQLNQQKEHQIVELSKVTCKATSELLAKAYRLAESVEGEEGVRVDVQGARVADNARALLTTAQITAPSVHEPNCRTALLSAADGLAETVHHLAAEWKPLVQRPELRPLGEELDLARQNVDQHIENLIKACDISHDIVMAPLSPNQETRRNKFAARKSAAQSALQIAENELDKPTIETKVSGQVGDELQRSLATKLAQLNAAIASLISATSDHRNPNYEAAEDALNTISQLMPAVVKDTKTLSSGKSDIERQAVLDDIRELCDATRGICASDGQLGDGDLSDAAIKFANSSGRLFYTFSPHLNQQKEHQIIDLSKLTCEATSELLARAYRVAESVGGEQGARVDARGARVADNAQTLLTTAQITALSVHEPSCRTALLSAAEGLAESADNLAEEWKPLVQKPELQLLGKELDHAKQVLEQRIKDLKKACEAAGDTNEPTLTRDQEKRRIKFITTKSAAHDAVRNAEKELDKPAIGIKTSGPSHEDLRRSLSKKLAELNAAIASLITATSDNENVDYEAAENALNSLSQLMPTVVKDAKTLSAVKNDKERQAMLDDIRALCDATRGVCASDGQLGEEDFKNYATKYANVSGRLFYTISPHLDQQKEHQIIDLSKVTCEAVSELLARANRVAESVGGEEGARVDARGARVADNAQALLTTAQITAPSLHEPQCRTALLSAADRLAESAHHLAAEWTPLVQRPELQPLGNELDHSQQNLDRHIEKLKIGCKDTNVKTKPAVPVRKGSLKGKKSGELLSEFVKNKDLTKEFLHQLCHEASHDIVASSEDSAKREQERKLREDQRKAHEQFVRDMDESAERIEKIEKSLKKKCNSPKGKGGATSSAELLEAQKRMERNLALASVAVSSLVASNHPQQIDYSGASKSTSKLSELLPVIVEDAILISGSLEDKSRKPFLDNVLSVCKSSQQLCHSAKDNPGSINDNAVEFGNTSAKLLYAVSTEFDPSQEKAVIERAKLIGDNASRVSLSGVTAAKLVGEEDDKLSNIICEAGGRCADAAGSLVYTAKLVAPSIQHPECQETLTKASDHLSTCLSEFSDTWTSLTPDPKYAQCLQDLESESSDLAALLQKLKQELKEGVLLKKREPKLVIEDTPFRQLATKILEDAKIRAESTDLPETERRDFAKYSNQLADAVHLMDIANAKCRQSPHDLKKREELEDCVQNIQHILLQLRSRRGDTPQSNIVDLTDYVKEVSSAAEGLIETANSFVNTAGKHSEVEDIKNECHKITLNAFRLLSPSQSNSDGTTEDDILQVDQFGQDCELRVQNIKSLLDNQSNKKLQDALREDDTSLRERCNLLRFATKSALATAKSAALEETINDLNDLEAKIDKMLLTGLKGNHKMRKYNAESASVLLSRAEVSAAVARAGSGEPQNLVPSLNKYIAQLRTTDAADTHNKKLLSEHLSRLVQTLKCYAVTISRRVATWQRIDEDQISTVTQHISQEFEDADNIFGKSGTKSDQVLKAKDVNKLLVPNNAQVTGDKKQLEDQVQRLATKLNSMTGTIILSVHKPESLARSASATVDAALQLASTARGLKDSDNTVQSKKIEDSSQEMCFTTYNLLKIGESVCHDPNNTLHRRRLLDACRALNDAINKLVRTSSTTSPDKLQTECNELSRTVQLHQAFLQPTHPTCALSYDESFEAIQQQSDIIHKLKDNKPMSREEFGQSLAYVTSATCNSMEYATQCAYLLSISEQHKEAAKSGLIDVGRIQKNTGTIQQICFRVMRSAFIEDAKAEEGNLNREVQELQQAITEASAKPLDGEVKDQLIEAGQKVTSSFGELQSVFNRRNPKEVDLAPVTINMIDAVSEVNSAIEHPSVVPKSGTTPVETQRSGEVIQSSRDFVSHLLALLKDVKDKKYKANDEDDAMTWVMFNDRRKYVLDTFEALINRIRENGKLSGVTVTPNAEDIGEDLIPKKSHIQLQVDLANKWLQRPIPKSDVKVAGQKAAKEVIDIAEKMAEDLQGTEKEEISHLISETDQLLGECSRNYDSEKASLLMDKLKELRKALERLVVTRVVEDFIEEETPLEDLEILTDAERDENKRKLILEKKIAELLAQLSKVTKTARFVADTGTGNHAVSQELKTCSNQAELLAPMLVKAAQERVNSPNNQAAIDHYKSLLDEYARAMSKVRDLCDMSVDPLDFVQTAGDTMQRMRDESTEDNCPVKAFKVSSAIDKLVNRVFDVGMHNARSDPELQTALSAARDRLAQIRPAPDTRPSKMPDWKLTTAEILRTTGEVESVLGGEIIFKKQPEPDQPIYNAALDLHAAIREWSARDNEIVAVAKRMAVLMAKLSEYMNNNKKREVIFTSKSIVEESHEVAHLAKKLALECTDIRIRTNLLQVCERIPTISGQLKMLTTVKSSFLGHQGTEEDKEAMNTLIGNAQNLMMSVQEVVKAAASASVKINAQRGGPRMRWVRRNVFY